METKHTLGPWLRDGNMIYSLMHAGWRKGEELFKNRFHAYVQSDRECPDEEHEANVKLIAAAPDLLEALKEARRIVADSLEAFGECDHSVGICNCDMKRSIEASDTAIKKATQ